MTLVLFALLAAVPHRSFDSLPTGNGFGFSVRAGNYQRYVSGDYTQPLTRRIKHLR